MGEWLTEVMGEDCWVHYYVQRNRRYRALWGNDWQRYWERIAECIIMFRGTESTEHHGGMIDRGNGRGLLSALLCSEERKVQSIMWEWLTEVLGEDCWVHYYVQRNSRYRASWGNDWERYWVRIVECIIMLRATEGTPLDHTAGLHLHFTPAS